MISGGRGLGRTRPGRVTKHMVMQPLPAQGPVHVLSATYSKRLLWTCSSTPPPDETRFSPFVYLLCQGVLLGPGRSDGQAGISPVLPVIII